MKTKIEFEECLKDSPKFRLVNIAHSVDLIFLIAMMPLVNTIHIYIVMCAPENRNLIMYAFVFLIMHTHTNAYAQTNT